MNATMRAALLAEPVPMQQPGQPAASCVVRTDAGWQLAWLIGLSKQPFGPTFSTAREAAQASLQLNERGRE